MSNAFLLYGSTGFVGREIARTAARQKLPVILAGRDAVAVKAQAQELGLPFRVFALDDPAAMDQALQEVSVVLHGAGPYIHTSRPMADGCIRNGVHYLDLTGEIPVYEALAARSAEAEANGVMLLPGVGFDVLPSDCLALHLKRRLPSAVRLTLAFQSRGPAALPPGTANTLMEMIPYGLMVRKQGKIQPAPRELLSRRIDFGRGGMDATLLTWGDIFTAYYSTGIPNICVYNGLPRSVSRQLNLLYRVRTLFKIKAVRQFVRGMLKAGSTAEERLKTRTHLWGRAEDDHGRSAESRLRGPEGGVDWTVSAALAVVKKVLAGHVFPGFQTPAKAYGADLVLECPDVIREDER